MISGGYRQGSITGPVHLKLHGRYSWEIAFHLSKNISLSYGIAKYMHCLSYIMPAMSGCKSAAYGLSAPGFSLGGHSIKIIHHPDLFRFPQGTAVSSHQDHGFSFPFISIYYPHISGPERHMSGPPSLRDPVLFHLYLCRQLRLIRPLPKVSVLPCLSQQAAGTIIMQSRKCFRNRSAVPQPEGR